MAGPATRDELGQPLPSATAFANMQKITAVEQFWDQSLLAPGVRCAAPRRPRRRRRLTAATRRPGRVFIREGLLTKVCRKSDQPR